MDLKTYWLSLDAPGRKRWAKRAGTNIAYLSQIVHGHRMASPELARKLSNASESEVQLGKIRPDIWPEAVA